MRLAAALVTVALAVVGGLVVLLARIAAALWLTPPRVSDTWRADHFRDWRNDDGRP